MYFLNYFGQAERCFGVHWSDLGDLRSFGIQKWLFSYINRQNIFLYCSAKAMLGNVELSAINHSGEKGFLFTLGHHPTTYSSLKMAVLIGILSFFAD